MRPPVGGLIARASFPAALHQAPGGWRPAPSHSWPKGRRLCREILRRHPDPWWPLQTSERWPLVPLDIFYPAQSGSPLLPVTLRSSRSDYALRRNPFQENCTKVNLRWGLCPGMHGCGVSPRREASRFPCGWNEAGCRRGRRRTHRNWNWARPAGFPGANAARSCPAGGIWKGYVGP